MTDVITGLESKLVSQLKSFLPSPFFVDGFPDDPRDFDMSGYRAVCLVHYSGSRYGKPSGQVQQSRELRFSLALYLYALHGGEEDDRLGSYAAIELVRRAVQNIKLPGCKPFYLISDQLVGQQAGRWDWQVDIACEALAIAADHNIPRPKFPINQTRQEA